MLASGEVGAANISLHVEINDLKSKEIEAKYTTGAGTKEIGWVTDALPMPSKDKQSTGCARIPEYMDGAGQGWGITPLGSHATRTDAVASILSIAPQSKGGAATS